MRHASSSATISNRCISFSAATALRNSSSKTAQAHAALAQWRPSAARAGLGGICRHAAGTCQHHVEQHRASDEDVRHKKEGDGVVGLAGGEEAARDGAGPAVSRHHLHHGEERRQEGPEVLWTLHSENMCPQNGINGGHYEEDDEGVGDRYDAVQERGDDAVGVLEPPEQPDHPQRFDDPALGTRSRRVAASH